MDRPYALTVTAIAFVLSQFPHYMPTWAVVAVLILNVLMTMYWVAVVWSQSEKPGA